MGRRLALWSVICSALLCGAAAARPPAARPAAPRADRGVATRADQQASAEATALNEKGLALFREKRYAEALATFGASLRRASSAQALYNAAACHARLGALDQALLTYQRVVIEFPQDNLREGAEGKIAELRVRIEEARGKEALTQGRSDEAVEAFRAVYRLQPEVRNLLKLAEALGKAGRFDEAARAYERALQEDLPPSMRDAAEKALDDVRGRAEAARGQALLASRQHGEAVQAFERALRLRTAPELLLPLALALRGAGRNEEAVRVLERVGKEDSDAARRREAEAALPELRARALGDRGAELVRRGDRDGALAAYAAADRLAPSPTFLVRSARAHRVFGDTGRALAAYERALRQKELLPVDERIETEAAVRELQQHERGQAALREQTGRPPVWRRPWFAPLMAGVAITLGVTVGLSAAAGSGLSFSRSGPTPPPTDFQAGVSF